MHSLLVVFMFMQCILYPSCSKKAHDFAAANKQSRANTTDKKYISRLDARWHPQESDELHRSLDNYLALSKKHFDANCTLHSTRILVVPHGRMVDTALCAASAYQTLIDKHGNKNQTIKRVIILAPSPAHFYNRIALPDYDLYENVLGTLNVDKQAIMRLAKDPLFRHYQSAHEHNDALEIHLPFIQKTIASCSIVPLVVGTLRLEDPSLASHMLQRIIDESTLLVISSNFTHHGTDYDYTMFNKEIARNIRHLDNYIAQAMLEQSQKAWSDALTKTHVPISSPDSIKILLALLEQQNFAAVQGYIGSYYTSAHIHQATDPHSNDINILKLFQDPSDNTMAHSVSYASAIFYAPPQTVSAKHKL